MNREEKILSFIDRKGLGLEIGPSHRPIAPKSKGFKVEIIDHLDQAGLKQKYKDHNLDLDQIEPVDYVWHGESYADLVGRRHAYRWIIASHLIEHTPDLIAFLLSCEDVLEEGGVLALAIPDKRYCFDHTRPLASLASIIDAHDQKRVIHSAGTAADYFLNVVKKDGKIAWDKSTRGKIEYVHTADDAVKGMDAIRTNGSFLDLHAWCFTPASFRLIMRDLHELGYTRLRETRYFDTEGSEFFIALSRSGAGPAESRLELATQNV